MIVTFARKDNLDCVLQNLNGYNQRVVAFVKGADERHESFENGIQTMMYDVQVQMNRAISGTNWCGDELGQVTNVSVSLHQ